MTSPSLLISNWSFPLRCQISHKKSDKKLAIFISPGSEGDGFWLLNKIRGGGNATKYIVAFSLQEHNENV